MWIFFKFNTLKNYFLANFLDVLTIIVYHYRLYRTSITNIYKFLFPKFYMVKKSVTPKKKAMSKAELEEALLNNFVNLQKVLTNLSVKFEELSSNISKLLQLFEISAKSFAEKYTGSETGVDKDFLKKLDSLLDQNKTIAKGIMMMEEKIRNRQPSSSPIERNRFEGMTRSKPLPKF